MKSMTQYKYNRRIIKRLTGLLAVFSLLVIIDKDYAKSYYIKGKPIEGIGMSFSQKSRNVDFYKQEMLYTPSISIYG